MPKLCRMVLRRFVGRIPAGTPKGAGSKKCRESCGASAAQGMARKLAACARTSGSDGRLAQKGSIGYWVNAYQSSSKLLLLPLDKGVESRSVILRWPWKTIRGVQIKRGWVCLGEHALAQKSLENTVNTVQKFQKLL